MPYLAHVSLLVRDYDQAIDYYSHLGFEVVEDTVIPEQQKRWVTIRPPPHQPLPSSPSAAPQTDSPDAKIEEATASKSGLASSQGAIILLARPSNAEQEDFVGNQTGGRVFLFLGTDDFDRDYKRFTDAGVEWVRPPKTEVYGKVAVWKDLYGNLWDLIQYL
jgi:catechol 2,3-dioxygenase-like lactoylglutathione lyase family enzyme